MAGPLMSLYLVLKGHWVSLALAAGLEERSPVPMSQCLDRHSVIPPQ